MLAPRQKAPVKVARRGSSGRAHTGTRLTFPRRLPYAQSVIAKLRAGFVHHHGPYRPGGDV